MKFSRFKEICREYNYPDDVIKMLWDNSTVPRELLEEDKVRIACSETEDAVKLYVSSKKDEKITRERFVELCKEEGYPDSLTNRLWTGTEANGGASEFAVRMTMKAMKKDNDSSSTLKILKLLEKILGKDVVEKEDMKDVIKDLVKINKA